MNRHGVRMTAFLAVFLAASLTVALTGCKNKDGSWKKISLSKKSRKDKNIVVPPEIKGTVAEVCTLISSADAPISAWGIVVGLGDKGSSEVPPELKADLTKYLKGQIKISRATLDTDGVTVDGFLRDRDTAIIRVEAIIPPGAPAGTKVDVLVSAPSRTQTISLEGGVLLPIDLRWERGTGGMRGRYLKPLGRAEGSIFVNPFLNPKKPADRVRQRQGRILGGAMVLKDMPLRLQLREPDYLMCNTLQKRINERFRHRGTDVAEAKTRYYLDIRIPGAYRNDYRHFLELLMHLSRRSGPGVFEAHANRIAKAMEAPEANHNSLAMVWEAMGRGVRPVVQKMYASKNLDVAYFSARTGLRLGDRALAGPIIVRIASDPKHPHQLKAIEELGRHPGLHEAIRPLRDLLNHSNKLVRISAYEAMVKRRDFSTITRHNLDKGAFQEEEPAFTVDVVDTAGDFIVYARHTRIPRIVLFGRNMPLARSIFYNDPNEIITIFSKKGLTPAQIEKLKKADPRLADDVLRKDHVVAYRKFPKSDAISKKYRVPFLVWPLIRVLSSRPRPDAETGMVPGLGLTYSQVVGTLSRLCKEKSIHAKFVLQQLPELHKIYQMTPTEGRPDRKDR